MCKAKKYCSHPMWFTYLIIVILLGCFWGAILYPLLSDESVLAKLIVEFELLLVGSLAIIVICFEESKNRKIENETSVQNG